MERLEPTGIRLRRRSGRNVFVFHREGSELYELEELPPFEPETETIRVAAATEGPETEHDRPADGTWSRTSVSKLRRVLGRGPADESKSA